MDIQEQLRAKIREKRDQMIELQRDLTATPALGPMNGGDGEWDKARVLEGWVKRLGLGACEVFPAPDPQVSSKDRPNMVATLSGKSKDGVLWIMSHLDIVPPGEPSLWLSDPYRMVVDGDRLTGRGVEDNQQGMVCSLFAAACLKELGLVPARDVKLLFVADEETGSEHGAKYLAVNTRLFGPRDRALVPDGGSVDGAQIEIAEKSILWLRFHVRGKQCHGSTPEKGKNAFAAGSHLVVRLGALKERYTAKDALFDPPVSTFEPTKKEANVPNVNTIPGDDVFYFDCRVLPRESLEEIMRVVRGICDGVERDFGVGVDIQEVQRASSPPTPANAPFIATLSRVISAVYGVEAKTIGIGGGTVGAFLREKGIPTAVWSKIEETAHQPNEHCSVENMMNDALVMASLMLREE